MKNLIFLFSALYCFATAGCTKFLAEQSQDELRPATVQDLVGILAAEGYPYQTNINPFLELMTDDVQCNGGQGRETFAAVVRAGRAPFTWSKNVYQDLLLPDGWTNTTFVNSWAILYARIGGCNTVISHINKVRGPEGQLNNLLGQALTLRAYYYFLLVNMYGAPYNAPGIDPNTSPGVPLKLRMEVTDSLYPRNSVAEVYRQIEADLKAGISIMQNNPQNNGIYKMSPAAGYALLSRMHLYKDEWEMAIAYSDSAIRLKPDLTVLSTYRAVRPGGYYLFNNATTFVFGNRIYDPVLSKEIIWTYLPIGPNTGSSEDAVFRSFVNPVAYNNTIEPPYSISNELLSLYETRPMADTSVYLADLRIRTYFMTTLFNASFSPPAFGFKFYGGTNGVGGAGLRMGEVYLNRAEAKIQLGIKSGNAALFQAALDDLNKLRASRYDNRRPYVNISISNPQELLRFCREERRREFPFDSGHRWFDLRRYGMPSISHFYEEVPGTGETFTLQQGDSRYTLPIPNAALDRNAMLSQNP